jgi:hypothetical protein
VPAPEVVPEAVPVPEVVPAPVPDPEVVPVPVADPEVVPVAEVPLFPVLLLVFATLEPAAVEAVPPIEVSVLTLFGPEAFTLGTPFESSRPVGVRLVCGPMVPGKAEPIPPSEALATVSWSTTRVTPGILWIMLPSLCFSPTF